MKKIRYHQLLACLLFLFPLLSHAQSLTRYEYWFDDDVDDRTVVGLSGNTADIERSINVDHLSSGLHQFNLRFRQSDGMYSPVTSQLFLKLQAGGSREIEYWFDDDFEDRTSETLPSSSDGFSTTLNTSHLGNGMHWIYFRVKEPSGLYTAVNAHYFFKMQAEDGGLLEYWFDDKKSESKTVQGRFSSDGEGLIFVQDLDLKDVPAGSHFMYYRFVNADTTSTSAVSMTPVILHSRYNVKAEDLTMNKYRISIDNLEPMELDVLTPRQEITIPYTMDARDLTVGDHTINLSFQNSINTGVTVSEQFTVNDVVVPELVLNAKETNGLVELSYNPVPNDMRSRITRVNAGGAKVKVYESLYGSFTTYNNLYTDAPPAGDYTYYVQTVYADKDGQPKTLKSNEVHVHVAQALDEQTGCGYITGMIQQNTVSPKMVNIAFSDGTSALCYEGKFKRERIPVGTVLTLEVISGSSSSLALTYEPVTITIQPGENYVYIKGLTKEDMAPNNYNHDLVFASDLEWIGPEFKFLVKNWTKKTWKGTVRFRAISKKKADAGVEEEEIVDAGNPTWDGQSAQVGTGSVASMPQLIEKNYYYSSSEEITLYPGNTAPVTLSLENVFPDDKKDYYVFYIESIGGWTEGSDKSISTKPLAINNDFNVTDNPMVRLIDKSSLEKAKDAVLMADAEAAANLVLMVCGKINAFDGFLGNLQEFTDGMLKQTEKMLDLGFDLKYIDYVDRAMVMESFEELLADEMVLLYPKAVIGEVGNSLLKQFRENVKSDILEGAWKKVTIKDITAGSKFINDYLGKTMKVVKAIETYKDWKNMTTYEKHFYCAEAILNNFDKSSPFTKILKTYLDVSRAYINKALEYGETYYGQFESVYLYENIPSEKEKFDYNKFVDFKIEVQTNRLVDFNFNLHGTSAIREVKVMLSNRTENEVDTIYFQPIPVWDGVMLKQTKYIGNDPMSGGGNIDVGFPLKRLWMEIKWKNGRISKVPLLNRKNRTSGVELVISPTQPYKYVIRFKSGTTRYENLADIIELKE